MKQPRTQAGALVVRLSGWAVVATLRAHSGWCVRLGALAGLVVLPAAIGATETGWIVSFPAAREQALHSEGLEVWTRSGDVLVGGSDEEALTKLVEMGLAPLASVRDSGQWIYLFHHEDGVVSPPAPDADIFVLNGTTDLYLFPGERDVALPHVRPLGAFMGVARIPLAPMAPHVADLALAAQGSTAQGSEAANPLVTQIVNAASQAAWFQYVKDLSGENPVVVGGVSRTIGTRYSDAMFPTPEPNAFATEYLLEKGAGWGYSGTRESYTPSESGCAQGSEWQNVVFTIGGQVDYGEHQQVIFVTHYDSLSYSIEESFAYAPGADDAISGGAALIEALRVFKDYAFRNTVKIVFFSGEEEGLCGSTAYVRQHPAADMWRVVNMDQTAYDGNGDGLMNCYNLNAASSPQSVVLGDAFVQANSNYGPIVAPDNIVRDFSYMCQTDHCPFWNAGVAAIALLEDLHNRDLHTCFDQLQTPTCHDTVTQIDPDNPPRLMFDQEYSWPTERSALALVASLADPLYACPAAAPTLGSASGDHTVSLSWNAAAGVTNYVVERASSCAGPFTPIASASGTSYDDADLTNGTTYAYRIRTCPNQTSTCVSATPGSGVTPCADGCVAATASPTPTPTRPPTPTKTALSCPGDCSSNGSVAIEELVTLVAIALGNAQPSTCSHGIPSDSGVDIALLIQAVNHALRGCGVG